MRIIRRAFSIFPLFVLMAQLSVISAEAVFPATYYVSPQGADTQSGRSGGEAFRSIQRAVQSSLPGDTIFVLPGTYREVISIHDKNGLSDRPLCLIGYATQATDYPIIDGGAPVPSSTASNFWMTISRSSWIEVARLAFRDGWTSPIQVENSSYLSFRECRFYGGKRVIEARGTQSHHILVERCFWDQGGEYLWKLERDSLGEKAWTAMHHGSHEFFNGSLIDFSGTGGSMVIRYNTLINGFNAVRYRGRKGCDSNVEIYGNNVTRMRDNDFEPEYYTYNLHIYHNRSHNIHRTLSIDNVEGGNVYYYGNVTTTDTDPWSEEICAGFWKIYGKERQLQYPVYAFNNSFYGTGEAFSSKTNVTTLLRHFNNAYQFSGRGWGLFFWDPSCQFDYDVSNEPWSPRLLDNGQERHGKIGAIEFDDPAAGDLRLKSGSVGIDAGKIMELADFGWTQEFQGNAPDVGAYEDGQLVEGPPFRFAIPPGGTVAYREKPRVTRHRIRGNTLLLDFSERIDTGMVRKDHIALIKGEVPVTVASVTFADPYSAVITTAEMPDKGELTLRWNVLPVGLNGEPLTYWASTIRPYLLN